LELTRAVESVPARALRNEIAPGVVYRRRGSSNSEANGNGNISEKIRDVLKRKTLTCLKCFTRYGHYAGEVKDIIKGRLAVVSEIAVLKSDV